MSPTPPPVAAIEHPSHHQATVSAIVSFWFEHQEPMKVWFGSSASFDRSIVEAFGASMQAAAKGELDSWQDSPQGTLALLILLDQFPRNVYRGDARAFATDPKAVQVALGALAKGFDRKVPFMQQVFFYLPLEHDEDLKSQVACVALTKGLLDRAKADERKMAQAFLDFALRHQATILAFGRYPSRNKALGRASSAAEEAHLKKHPMGF